MQVKLGPDTERKHGVFAMAHRWMSHTTLCWMVLEAGCTLQSVASSVFLSDMVFANWRFGESGASDRSSLLGTRDNGPFFELKYDGLRALAKLQSAVSPFGP